MKVNFFAIPVTIPFVGKVLISESQEGLDFVFGLAASDGFGSSYWNWNVGNVELESIRRSSLLVTTGFLFAYTCAHIPITGVSLHPSTAIFMLNSSVC